MGCWFQAWLGRAASVTSGGVVIGWNRCCQKILSEKVIGYGRDPTVMVAFGEFHGEIDMTGMKHGHYMGCRN